MTNRSRETMTRALGDAPFNALTFVALSELRLF